MCSECDDLRAQLLAERQARLELERQLAEADAVIDRYAENVSLLHYPDPQYEHMKAALSRHASRSDDRRDTP